jgi:hypothetical protein
MQQQYVESGFKRARLEATDVERAAYVEMENQIVSAIFQVGLAQSSPKSLIMLMPETPNLTRE